MPVKRFLRHVKSRGRHHFDEVMKTKRTPTSLALGFALGTFLAVLPTPGSSIFLGFLLILIFEKISKISLIAAMAFWNPITLIPVYYLSYIIGNNLVGELPDVVLKIVILDQMYQFTRQFLVGNTILAVIFSVISFFIVKAIAKRYQQYY